MGTAVGRRAHLIRACAMFFSEATSKKRFLNIAPTALEDPKKEIAEEIRATSIEMCREVSENFRNRLQQRIAADGRHLSDIIIFLKRNQIKRDYLLV